MQTKSSVERLNVERSLAFQHAAENQLKSSSSNLLEKLSPEVALLRTSLDHSNNKHSSIMPSVVPMGIDSDASPAAAGSSIIKKKAHGVTDFSSQFEVNAPVAQSKIVIPRSHITAENSNAAEGSGNNNGRVVRKSHNKTASMVDSQDVNSATAMKIETNSHDRGRMNNPRQGPRESQQYDAFGEMGSPSVVGHDQTFNGF